MRHRASPKFYQVTQLRFLWRSRSIICRHRASSAQGSLKTRASYSGNTMDQLMCTPLFLEDVHLRQVYWSLLRCGDSDTIPVKRETSTWCISQKKCGILLYLLAEWLNSNQNHIENKNATEDSIKVRPLPRRLSFFQERLQNQLSLSLKRTSASSFSAVLVAWLNSTHQHLLALSHCKPFAWRW